MRLPPLPVATTGKKRWSEQVGESVKSSKGVVNGCDLRKPAPTRLRSTPSHFPGSRRSGGMARRGIDCLVRTEAYEQPGGSSSLGRLELLGGLCSVRDTDGRARRAPLEPLLPKEPLDEHYLDHQPNPCLGNGLHGKVHQMYELWKVRSGTSR